jgi:two-component sensor histidine kinase
MVGWNSIRSLTAKLAALLTIALLPLGLIAVFQTYNVVSEAGTLSQRDMVARTSEVAQAQVDLIGRAQSAATALSAAVMEVGPETSACNNIMQGFTRKNAGFIFAGFIENSGNMRCVSGGDPVDFSSWESWVEFSADPRPNVVINREGASSGLSVLIVNMPAFDEAGAFLGSTSISIPHDLLDLLQANEIEGVDVALTDTAGAVMSVSGDKLGASLAGTAGFAPGALDIPDQGMVVDIDGYTAATVIPLRPFDLFIVGSWSNGSNPLSVSTLGTAAPLFPIAMWLASLFVAIFAIQYLVLRHLKTLRRGMRNVSLENIDASYVRLEGAPSELSDIGASYNALLDQISLDATTLEEAAEEKELLLKEVHHRVKNNLQLIASILNMQLRQLESPDAKTVLQRVQQRVMSLAAIHKLLYTDTKIDRVRIDLLLSEIINNSAILGADGSKAPKMSVELAAIELDPDRAVPLALLVTEAVTNSMKYVGDQDGTSGEIAVSVTEQRPERLLLRVRNSLGDGTKSESDMGGTGLGSKLITAFVTQLDGEMQIERLDNAFEITVEFPKDVQQPATEKAT